MIQKNTLTLNRLKVAISPLFFQQYKAYLAQPNDAETDYKKINKEIVSLLNGINELQQNHICQVVGTSVNARSVLIIVENKSDALTHIRSIFKKSTMKIKRIDSVYDYGVDYTPYLLNAAAKMIFLKDLPDGAVFARGYGVGFFQKNLSMSFNVYFKSDQPPFVKIMSMAENMVLSEDPQEYMFAVSKTDLLYCLGSSKIRYEKRKGRTGSKKAIQHEFMSAPDAREGWLKSNAGSACINRVISALRNSGLVQIEPESVECITPDFSIATKSSKKNSRQFKQASLETELENTRFYSTDIISTWKTPQMINLISEAEIYAKACCCTPYAISIPSEWDTDNGFRFQILASTPIAVDFVSGSFRRMGVALSENHQEWENYKKKMPNKAGSFYFSAKKIEIYFTQPVEEAEITIRQLDEESEEIYEEKSFHLSLQEIETAIIEQKEESDPAHHIIIQTNDSDKKYDPDFSKQYVTAPELTDISSIKQGITLFTTIRKELLLVKADLLEQKAESFPAGYGWSCIWHQTGPEKQKKDGLRAGRKTIKNLMMSISETGQITVEELSKNYLYPDFENDNDIRGNYDYWCLKAPDGREYLIQPSDLRQILYDNGKGSYSRAQKAEGALIENIRANTGYQHFRYQDGDYYLVGWDNSNNWKEKYSYIPHIYQIFSETGSLTEEEWEQFFRLCDVGFVRATSDSTVLPAFAKYLREYDHVMTYRATNSATTEPSSTERITESHGV